LPGTAARSLKICLAASGGGHVRQLLDLEPAWREHAYFFVTEDTALGASLAMQHRTHFIAHYAVGQARLGSPFKMIASAARNLIQSLRIMLAERPDVIISTGAGAVFFSVAIARLMGARVIVIESFARFDHPSLFGRLAAPLAHDLIIQSEALASTYPRAKIFDPLRLLSGERPAKTPLLFATVGATLSFDRLVRTVAAAKADGQIPEEVLLQVGENGFKPAGLAARETLPFEEVKSVLRDADIVVCHGGTGSLITALREGCRVVAIPRQFKLQEHYDDHQVEITEAFAARGLIQVARSSEDFSRALAAARAMTPVRATTEPKALIDFLTTTLAKIQLARRR
jgi:UDP-N-acetylglucosamine--N-acetylmuramyl-(pentapeptide) pyrophosphoryl-undecaprenol N-acetylglucosamine transferase